MRRVGMMEFTLKGQQMALAAFNEVGAPDMNHLSLMFSDMTSGTETYAAGRYIDLERTASDIYALDFNLAYHPYCYYNPTYECPYPPAENRLKVPIHAGERMKKAARSRRRPMIRAVVFDFDGVIANSEPLHFRAFRDVLADAGIALTEARVLRELPRLRRRRRVSCDCRRRGTDLARGCRHRRPRRAQGGAARGARDRTASVLFPGAREAIARMAAVVADGHRIRRAEGRNPARARPRVAARPFSGRRRPRKTRRPASRIRRRICAPSKLLASTDTRTAAVGMCRDRRLEVGTGVSAGRRPAHRRHHAHLSCQPNWPTQLT